MRLASAIALVALGFLAWACASHSSVDAPASAAESRSAEDVGEPQTANEPRAAPSGVDLSRERQLVEEARAAATAVDLATARAKVGEAIELLLARPEPEHSAEWLELLDAASRLAWRAQDIRTARTAVEKLLEVRSRTLPDDHPEVQAQRGNLALMLKTLGDVATARTLQEKVLEVFSRTLPDDHARLQWARGNLAATLFTQGDLAAARALQERVLEVYSRTLPDDHPDLTRERQNFANTLRTLGDLSGARALEEKVLEINSRTLPGDHPDLQRARRNLAATLWSQGDAAAARELLVKALEVYVRTLPDDHPDFLAARQNLALAHYSLGDMAAARELQERVLEVSSRTLPEDHPQLQQARLNLASTINVQGDLAAARALQEKVLEAYSSTLAEDHPHLQVARGNLALTLRQLGDLAAARALEERVLEMRSRTLPDDHFDLLAARHNLAVTLALLGDLPAARALLEQVLETISRTLPDDHPHVQAARETLAATLTLLGDLAAARAFQEKILEVRSRSMPDDHHDLQKSRIHLASTLKSQGDFGAAQGLEEKALEVFSRTLPDDHQYVQTARMNLAFTLAARAASVAGEEEKSAQKEEGKAEFKRLATSFTRALARSARTAVLTASSREAEERCASSLTDLANALSFAEGLGVFESDAELEREVFALSEATRGAALATAHLSRRAAVDEGYGELREAMRTASDELARLAQQGAGADEIDRARSAREGAERAIAQMARELTDGESGLFEVDPASLSATLSEEEALVGYRRYTRRRLEHGERVEVAASESLCAFVLRSGDRLERFELGPVEAIDRAVSELRQAIGVVDGRGVGTGPAQGAKGSSVETAGGIVRRSIFDPLLPALEGAERIVVALDDVLHLVPLDALPLERTIGTPDTAEAELLGDRWRIETRCTLSELSWRSTPVTSGEALVAIGGAAFDLPPLLFSDEEAESIDEQPAAPAEVSFLLRGGAWEAGFVPLMETGIEAGGIADLHRGAFGGAGPAFVPEGRKASRDSLAELAPRARFLHVATHGWFAPESVRSMAEPGVLDAKMGFGSRMSGEERARGMSPMLLCGLALAGANLPEDELGRAPGLITAEELSALDLAGCELAVLSACDTNVGERRAGQGVASLQKALHMAGARTVITSLWKVPDEATRELMLDFYRRIWIEKKPKGVALWKAKMKIRDQKDERGRPLYSTRDWAAWVLTGEPN